MYICIYTFMYVYTITLYRGLGLGWLRAGRIRRFSNRTRAQGRHGFQQKSEHERKQHRRKEQLWKTNIPKVQRACET